MKGKRLKVVLVSDGTGETAKALIDAVMTQFQDSQIYLTRYKNIRTKEQIDAIFEEAKSDHDLLLYTLVEPSLRRYIATVSRQGRPRTLDLLGPALELFSESLNLRPEGGAGLLHAVNDEYFKRVEAMEFTLGHDDGRNLASLSQADIVLVGISRTSKTPLSLYLSQHGHKVVNIPMIYGIELPEEIFSIDQRKIFALTIDADTLENIRKNRIERLGAEAGGYAQRGSVTRELEWAERIFKENKRWPVLNVTGKAIEETAAEITRLINMRKNNIFKKKP